MKIIIVGLAFVAAALAYHVISNFWTIKHEVFYCCCGIKKPEVEFEKDDKNVDGETARIAPYTAGKVS
jgi:hypothetical protein